MVNRPSRSGDFTGNDNQCRGRTPAQATIMLVNGLPSLGFDGRHCGTKQQTAQLAWPALGQAAATDLVAGVVRHQVVTDERDERIGAAERNAFQRVGQGNADYGADTDDGLHALLRFDMLGRAGGDLGRGGVNPGDQGILFGQHRLELSGKAVQVFHREFERTLDAGEFGATFEQPVQPALIGADRRWAALGGV